MTFIPYGKQTIEQDEIDAVVEVLKSDWLTQGPTIKKFENQFANFVEAKYALAVSNGTAALHLSLLALNIGPGDEVITTPNTFLATANSILYTGATPVFVDISPKTLNIDVNLIERSITKKTKAITVVHFAGLPCDLDTIQKIAKKYSLFVIEDGCHALGGSYKNTKVGSCSFSEFTTFSFHPVKTITTGEGGMITTNNKKMYERLLKLRTHGVTKNPSELSQNPGPWYYEMQELGFNYRMTDIQAALGLTQLRKCDAFVQRRKEIARNYDNAFKEVSWIDTMSTDYDDRKSGHHLYVVKINFNRIEKSRSDVIKELYEKGIGTQVHYIPIYQQPYYQKLGYKSSDYPHTEKYYKEALSIPIYPKMSDDDINSVISAIKKLDS